MSLCFIYLDEIDKRIAKMTAAKKQISLKEFVGAAIRKQAKEEWGDIDFGFF